MICEKSKKYLIPLSLTLLRISIGVVMAVHGWAKLQNLAQTTEMFASLGLPYVKVMTYLAIAGELGGGIGLILGLITPLAAFGVACVMGVAVVMVHGSNGLLMKNNGFEYPMILFFVALFFIFHGAGPISLDAVFCCKKKACCDDKGQTQAL